MADAKRTSGPTTQEAKGSKRREDLDALLKRIAEHVGTGEAGATTTGRPSRPARPSGTESAAPLPAPAEPTTRVAPVAEAEAEASPASPIQPTSERGPVEGGADAELEMVRRDRSHWAAADQRATPALRISAPSTEIPALRSATGQPRGGEPRDAREVPAPQPSPMPPTQARRAALPDAGGDDGAAPLDWDRQAAEELSRFHEDAHDESIAMPAHASAPVLSASLGAGAAALAGDTGKVAMPLMESAAPRHGATAPATGMRDGAERSLIEAALRVEHALEALASKASVEALGGRMEVLAGRVSDAHVQLSRLDGIEGRLGDLSGKLTDEAIVELFGNLVPTADDLAKFAEDAAERAADRVLVAHAGSLAASHGVAGSQAGPPAGTPAAYGAQLGQLNALLGGFIDDRRRHDAGTLEALETLQLAMQHLLDRIEQVDRPDGVRPVVASAVAAHAAQVAAPIEPRAGYHAPMAVHDPVPMPMAVSDYERAFSEHHLALSEHDPVHEIGEARQRIEPTLANPHAEDHAHSHAQSHDGEEDLARLVAELEPELEPMAVTGPTLQLADGESEAPPMTDRQAFIAQARKAAERARAASAATAGAGKSGASKSDDKRSSRAMLPGSSMPKSSGMVRPGVLAVASLAAFLLAGYWLVGGSRLGLPKPAPGSVAAPIAAPIAAPAAVERNGVETPAATTRKSAAPSDGSGPDVDTGEQTQEPAAKGPGADRRSSVDEPPAPTDRSTLQVASVLPRDSEETGPYGITVQHTARPISIEALASARERAKMASLSGATASDALAKHGVAAVQGAPRTADEAPQVSAVTTGSTTVGSPGAGQPAAQQSLVLPPAATGPLSLRLKAAKGDAVAQFDIASRLAEGRGVPQNFREAAIWYQKSALQGLAVAQYRLATLYERGAGVKADPAQAKAWYQRAAEQGNLKAMHNLAVLSTATAGGTPDYEAAGRLFKAAAERGLADSQYNLAVLYEGGLGMPKDLGQAYLWYALAAKSGDGEAARRRDMLIQRLAPVLIQASDKKIAMWRPAASNVMANDVHSLGESLRRAESEETPASANE